MDEFLEHTLKVVFYQISSLSTYIRIIVNEENKNTIENIYIIEPNKKPTISEKKRYISKIRDEIYKICKDNNINFLDKTDLTYLVIITDKKILQKGLAKLKLKHTVYNFNNISVYNEYKKYLERSFSPTEIQHIQDLRYTKFLKKGIDE